MKVRLSLLSLASAALLIGGCSDDDDDDPNGPSDPTMSFFVTSTGSATGNLGGLAGADSRCQGLASGVGLGGKTWRAYLSVERDPSNGNNPTDARSRIGSGPWRNAAGVVVAQNVGELHSRSGDAAVFLDERGNRINGQWANSPTPNQHDILTGSTADGRLMSGMTCSDWTSDSSTQAAQIGHSDGLGPNMDPTPPRNSWNSAHANESCANTAPRGGAGKLYCFAIN